MDCEVKKSIKEWQQEVHAIAVSKGWYDEDDGRGTPELLMLIVSELGEAMEEYRVQEDLRVVNWAHAPKGQEESKPWGFPIEIADTAIRLFDMCEYLGIDLEECIRIKHEYNKTRSYRHGGKRA